MATAVPGAILVLAGLLVPSWGMLTVFGFTVVILLAAEPSGLVAKALSTRVMLFLGEISFSIYLLHWILLLVSDRLRDAMHVEGPAALAWFGCYLGLVITLSAGTYRFIEIPARRRLRGARVIVAAPA